MNTPASRVAELWSLLETHYAPTLTEADDATLRSLDDLEIDGKLTNSHFEHTKAKLLDRTRSYVVDHSTGKVDPAFRQGRTEEDEHLFGDYELIIDTCLNGNPEVKKAVRRAYDDERRGLATLKYHLGRAKVKLPANVASIMSACESDQEYYEELKVRAEKSKGDVRNITETASGRYAVSMMVHGKRHKSTFDELEDAQLHRSFLTGRGSFDLEGAEGRLSGV